SHLYLLTVIPPERPPCMSCSVAGAMQCVSLTARLAPPCFFIQTVAGDARQTLPFDLSSGCRSTALRGASSAREVCGGYLGSDFWRHHGRGCPRNGAIQCAVRVARQPARARSQRGGTEFRAPGATSALPAAVPLRRRIGVCRNLRPGPRHQRRLL